MNDKFKIFLALSFLIHLFVMLGFSDLSSLRNKSLEIQEEQLQTSETDSLLPAETPLPLNPQLADSLWRMCLPQEFSDIDSAQLEEFKMENVKPNQNQKAGKKPPTLPNKDFEKIALIELVRDETYCLFSEILCGEITDIQIEYSDTNSPDMSGLFDNFYAKPEAENEKSNPFLEKIQEMLDDPEWNQHLVDALNLAYRQALIDHLKKLIDSSIESAVCTLCRLGQCSSQPNNVKIANIGKNPNSSPNNLHSTPQSAIEYYDTFLSLLEKELGFQGQSFPGLTAAMRDSTLLKSLSQYVKESVTRQFADSSGFAQVANDINYSEILKNSLCHNSENSKGKGISKRTLAQLALKYFNRLSLGRPAFVFNHATKRGYTDILSYLADRHFSQTNEKDWIYPYVYPLQRKYEAYAQKVRGRIVEMPKLKRTRGNIVSSSNENFVRPKDILLLTRFKKAKQEEISQELIKPDFPFHAFGAAMRTDLPITIDGDLSEWQTQDAFKLNGEIIGQETVPEYLSACNHLLAKWDNRGFYFAYWLNDARDETPSLKRFWQGDVFELFFDPFNQKDSTRIYKRNYQFWIWPREPEKSGNIGESVFATSQKYYPRVLENKEIQFASQRHGKRYYCEVFFPASLLANFRMQAGKIIGFNYSINTGHLYIRWLTNMSKNISMNPNLWGDLLLMGASADISTGQNYIITGQTIDLRITDHDMNLDAESRDYINAIAKSRQTGHRIRVTLIENALNSGQFETKVPTRFQQDSTDGQSLHVIPGDEITIDYIDQFSFNGEQDVPVKLQIPVATGIFSFN